MYKQENTKIQMWRAIQRKIVKWPSLALFAQKRVKTKVVSKINRSQLTEVVHNLNLDSVIYPKNLCTERILQYVRAKQNAIGSNIVTLYRNPTFSTLRLSLLRLTNDKTPAKLTTDVTAFIQSANQFLRSWVKLRFPTQFCQLRHKHLDNLLIGILFVHSYSSS